MLAAGKLGVITEMIRRDETPPGTGRHGDLPDDWTASLRHELAGALSCSTQSAETTAWLAWECRARLPRTGALLAAGVLTYAKARAVAETFRYLSDAHAAAAESLICGQLAGKTYPQVTRLAEQAALAVDPDLAARRREQAQKRDARVVLFREQQGTAGLSGRDLPPDAALAAMASVNARAEEYADSGAFGDARTDMLRACAYLDLLNGVTAQDRIACAAPQDDAADAAESLAWAEARAARNASAEPGTPASSDAQAPDTPGDGGADPDSCECPCAGCQPRGDDDRPDDVSGDHGDGDDDRPDDDSGGPSDGGDPGDGGGPRSGDPATGPGVPSAGRALQSRPPDLVVPLATLLGLAERPGEIYPLGALDPALARQMATAAAASPHSRICVTVTSPEGYAIGHGCTRREPVTHTAPPIGPPGAAGFPARLNLTIPASALPGLTAITRHDRPWALFPRGSPSPPARTQPPGTPDPPRRPGVADGYGTWTLILPGGRRATVRLDPVPVHDCDHRYQTSAYQPGARLRHLIQIRDGTCTFPPCNRHARDSDFEHAQPYHQGGKTCACNAGARSRACHRVKQSKGWNVTQPRPGWHQWQTPAGRIYTQEPWRYPA